MIPQSIKTELESPSSIAADQKAIEKGATVAVELWGSAAAIEIRAIAQGHEGFLPRTPSVFTPYGLRKYFKVGGSLTFDATTIEMGVFVRPLTVTVKTESPIEAQLLAALQPLIPAGVEFDSQVEVLGYRLDFALVRGDTKIDIECDGHAYHERTKEQAAHDRKRDRALTAAGWLVCRFTGSEIYRDAAACAREAVAMLGTCR